MNSGIRRDVVLFHLLFHHLGRDRRHSRQHADEARHVHPGVADRGDLDVTEALRVDGVEPEEGEEEVRLDALGARTVGHDQSRVDALQRALRDDDGDLFNRVAHGNSFRDPRLDAAARLGDAGDLRGQFRGPLGEELVELLDRDARGLAEHAHGRTGALGSYSARMKRTTFHCWSFISSIPSRLASSTAMASFHLLGSSRKPSSFSSTSMPPIVSTLIAGPPLSLGYSVRVCRRVASGW